MGSSSKITEEDKRSYTKIVNGSVKREDYESLKENIQNVEMKEHEEDESARRKFLATYNNDLRRHAPSRRPPISKYQSFFYGLCYACNNYGNKAINCRTYARYRNEWGETGMKTPSTKPKKIISGSHS